MIVGPEVINRGKGYNDNYQRKYRQVPRIDRMEALPYFRLVGSCPDSYWVYLWQVHLANKFPADGLALYPSVYDKAYARMYQKANLALSLWEAGKSLRMIAMRARQIALAARYLKRLQFHAFANTLGIRGYHPPSRSRVRKITQSGGDVSSLWLEYTFGWKPLVQDIYNATQVLQQDFNFSKFKASRSVPAYVDYVNSSGFGYAASAAVWCNVGGYVRITNPNLFLANQLGLTNPAAVAYDAIPFSFVLDWFLPVQKFLASFQNDVGLEMKGLYRGHGAKWNGYGNHESGAHGGLRGVQYERARLNSLPVPSIASRLRVPDASPWLAMTSVSLAVQQLNGLVARKRL